MSVTPEEKARRYALGAIEGEASGLATTCEGQRDKDLNDAAYACGRFLENYPVSESEIEDKLLAAIGPHLDARRTEQWAIKKIRHGMKDGRRNQRPGYNGQPISSTGKRLKGEADRPASRPPVPEKQPPPREEVVGIWEACLRVDATVEPADWNLEPMQWLEGRGLDSEAVAAYNLARMFPEAIELPEWAGFKNKRRWPEGGFRLVVPLWSAQGRMESLHARRTKAWGQSKGAFPLGCSYKGLAMANGPAVDMLQGKRSPAKVILAEGIPDYLTAATMMPAAAVFGCAQGSWVEGHASAIPDAATVYLCSDLDGAGAKYVERQRATFAGRNVNLRVLDKKKMGA